MRNIYLDNAATTKPAKEVIEAMMPYYLEYWGNPSSIHSYGREAAEALENSREIARTFLNAKSSSEIIFTAGRTESDNLAIIGAARANIKKGKHIITSSIEHHAVSHTLEYLQKKEGYEITYLPVNPDKMPDIIERMKTELK